METIPLQLWILEDDTEQLRISINNSHQAVLDAPQCMELLEALDRKAPSARLSGVRLVERVVEATNFDQEGYTEENYGDDEYVVDSWSVYDPDESQPVEFELQFLHEDDRAAFERWLLDHHTVNWMTLL